MIKIILLGKIFYTESVLTRERLAKNIRDAREKSGYTRKYVAKVLNCTVNTVHNWENGIRVPGGLALAELVRLLNISRKELIR